MGIREAMVILAAALVVGGSVVYGLRTSQEASKESLRIVARVSRIQNLAAACAAVAISDIDDADSIGILVERSVVWLALTGERDPDDSLTFKNRRITNAIVGECYDSFYSSPEYTDVREHMLNH